MLTDELAQKVGLPDAAARELAVAQHEHENPEGGRACRRRRRGSAAQQAPAPAAEIFLPICLETPEALAAFCPSASHEDLATSSTPVSFTLTSAAMSGRRLDFAPS